jgi:ketosteroid isomerase-like protein
MKIKFLAILCLLTLGFAKTSFANTQDSKAVKQVEARVEQLRQAMIDADAPKLKELTATELSYGHSGGHIQDQAEFIEKIVNGSSDFVTIELKDQTIQLVKDIAIVRHTLVATTNNNGKPGDVEIGVMLIWQKQKGTWKLLARQAFHAH